MKNQVISSKEFRKLRRNRKSIYGNERKYYNFNDKILKLYPNDELKIREEVIDQLFASEEIANLLYPEEKIYLESKFQGVLLPTLDNYSTLLRLVDDNDITYKERLKQLSKIVKCVKQLHNNDFAYLNLNLNKIVVNGNDIKLIDSDESFIKERLKNESFENAKCEDQYSLIITSLSYIYRFNFQRYITKNGIDAFKNILPLFPLEDGAINYISDVVNQKNVTEEYIDDYFSDFGVTASTCKKQRILR